MGKVRDLYDTRVRPMVPFSASICGCNAATPAAITRQIPGQNGVVRYAAEHRAVPAG